MIIPIRYPIIIALLVFIAFKVYHIDKNNPAQA